MFNNVSSMKNFVVELSVYSEVLSMQLFCNESTTGADASVKVQDMKLLDLASLAVCSLQFA